MNYMISMIQVLINFQYIRQSKQKKVANFQLFVEILFFVINEKKLIETTEIRFSFIYLFEMTAKGKTIKNSNTIKLNK